MQQQRPTLVRPQETAVSAVVNGADVRVVLAMSAAPSFDLIVHPSITHVQQLRGKKSVLPDSVA